MMEITPTGFAESGKWNGDRTKSARFTDQQLDEMESRGIDRESVRTVTVKLKRPRQRTAEEIGWGKPIGEFFDLVDVECPIVADTMYGPRVIAPGGDLHCFAGERRRK